ncbi:MAG: Crp/Fnr family transcriptional regulator [Anaerovoracaceae bacterium]
MSEVEVGDQGKAFNGLNVLKKKYNEGAMIFSEDEEIKMIGLVHCGLVRGEKPHLDGDIHLVYTYDKGEIFGLEGAASIIQTAPMNYVAEEGTQVLMIPMDSLFQGEYKVDLITALVRILASDNVKKLYKIEMLAKRSLRQRVMVYLEILRKKAGTNSFTINMDREQLAQYLCVNRSALSYELNEMQRDGLIRFKKNKFELVEK